MRLFGKSIVALSAALLLAGCSSAGSDGDSAAAPEADGAEAVETGASGEAQAPLQDRAVVYEAALDVRDDDPEAVAEAAWDLAASFGGYVTEDERDRSGEEEDEGYASARMVLRVPSESFAEAMDALTALADEELRRTVTTEDVTEATVDLAASIETQRASVERVRELLAEAESVQAILDLEAELAERESALAVMESQLADLQDRVAMSTIAFTVSSPPATGTTEPAGYKGPGNFWEGLVAGSSGALDVVLALSVVVGVLLPFTPIAAIVAAAIVLPIRFARKRRAAREQAAPPSPMLPPQPLVPGSPPRP